MKLLQKTIFLLLLLMFMGGVASCKGKTDKGAGAKAEPVIPNSGDAATFTIRYRPQWYHQAQFAGIYMAYKKGFYRNYGLNVVIQEGGMDNPAFESLESGITDITQLFLITAATRDAEKNNLVNLAQVSQKSSLMLVAKKSRGINSIQSLRNRTIGLWRSDFRDLSLIFVQQNNLNMRVVDIDWSVNLFLNDVIDVMNVMRYNEYHQLLQSGIDPDELFQVEFSELGLNIIEDGLYCTRDFYQKYPKQCQDFAQATMDGWMYAINHQEETVDIVLSIMQEHHIAANRTHQAWMLKVMRDVILAHPQEIGKLRESDFNQVIDLLKKQSRPFTKQTYKEFCPHAD